MRAPPREHEDLRKAARQVDTDQRDSLKRYLRASRQGAAAFPARLPRCTHDDDLVIMCAFGHHVCGQVPTARQSTQAQLSRKFRMRAAQRPERADKLNSIVAPAVGSRGGGGVQVSGIAGTVSITDTVDDCAHPTANEV